MITDCNICEELLVTEKVQNRLAKSGNMKPHICKKFGTQLFHMGRHPAIEPCLKCKEAQLKEGTF